MNIQHKLGGLFGKAILALGMVSVVPVILIGWYVLHIDSEVLQNEITDKQRTIAHRIAYAVSNEVSSQIQFFSVFTSLHVDFEEHPFIEQSDLDFLLKKNPQASLVLLLDKNGKVQLAAGTQKLETRDIPDIANVLATCVKEGREYIGAVSRVQEHLYTYMAFPVKYTYRDEQVQNVLLVKLNLDSLEQILQRQSIQGISTAIISADYNIMGFSLDSAFQTEGDKTSLQETLQYIRQYVQTDKSVKINLPKGQTVLVSSAPVSLLDWTVMVIQPANTIHSLLWQGTSHSWGMILMILGILLVFIIAVGYWVLIPIVRPLNRLNQVAIKFEQEDNYLPKETDLIIPDNEIGEFEHIFLHMAEVLAERKHALIAAQKRLQLSNEELEQRVQERTAALNQAMEKLVQAEKLSTIGQMASIISHEIRNPLAVISNATRLIKTIEHPTEPKIIKQFAIIEEEIQQANRIINEVLGFARSREMILSVIDLNSYVREILSSFPLPPKVHLADALEAESVNLKADAEELKQALRNLIANAAETMPEGGTVTVGSQVGRRVVCLYVMDEGPGISDEMKEKIFNPFFTTKARGTGLGLAVVRKAVSRHHGKLFVHRGKEKGSVFEIFLPIYNKKGDTSYGAAS